MERRNLLGEEPPLFEWWMITSLVLTSTVGVKAGWRNLLPAGWNYGGNTHLHSVQPPGRLKIKKIKYRLGLK